MRTSERADLSPRRAPSTTAIEALVLATAFAFIPEILGPRVASVPHPGWLVMLILGARYGGSGFLSGAAAVAAAVAAGSALAGASPREAWIRAGSAPDIAALGACLVVSWVASCHMQREADLRDRLRSLADHARGTEAAALALRGVAEALRARVDRTSASLVFLRDAARRLEGGDPVAPAEAAADLAIVRTGAAAVAVSAGEGRFERRVAVRDTRAPGASAPADRGSADLVVPLRAGGRRVGVIALWGIPPAALDRATAHDLDVIASWCGPALAAGAGASFATGAETTVGGADGASFVSASGALETLETR